MMTKIWVGMIMAGIIFAAVNHRLGAINDVIMNSCEEAIMFVLGLSGIIAVWSGLMNIAKESGLIVLLAEKAKPLVRLLFPE